MSRLLASTDMHSYHWTTTNTAVSCCVVTRNLFMTSWLKLSRTVWPLRLNFMKIMYEKVHTHHPRIENTWSQHLMSKYQRTRTHTMNLLPFLKLLLSLLQYRVHRVAFDLLITSWKRTLGSGWIERGTWAVVITGQKKRTGLKNRRIEKNWIHALISKS